MGLLRLLLAASVVIAHSSSIYGLTLVDSDVAVEAFYIISGFYMALILHEKYVGKNSYKLFITNRLLRIYPVYWLVALLTIVCLILFPNADAANTVKNYDQYFDKMNITSTIFLVFTNVFLLFQDVVMFLGINMDSGQLFFTPNFRETNPQLHTFLVVPQAWTIGIELIFYLIAPFLVRRSLGLLIFLIIISLIIRYSIWSLGFTNDPWSYRFLPSEILFFLLGAISYRIYTQLRNTRITSRFLFLIFLSLTVVTLMYGFFPPGFKKLGYLFLFVTCIPFIFLLTKNWQADRYLGELSYPIYISHLFVILCLKQLLESPLGIEVILTTITFSILLNEIVAKRIERYRLSRINVVRHASA